jgi:hypothetical protein
MKSAVKIEPRGLNPDDAAAFIGISRTTLDRCRAAGWIRPCVNLHRLVIYRPHTLELLLNRIEREGLPPDSGTPPPHHAGQAGA